MKLSDFNPLGNTSSLIAGETLTANDLVELDSYTGKGIKIDVADFAAAGNVTYGTAQTSAATGRIIAQTQITATQLSAYQRQAVCKDSSGNIFTVGFSGTKTQLLKYSAAGTLLGTVDLDGGLGASYTHKIFALSNGDICVVYTEGSNVYFTIYTANLALVKAITTAAAIGGFYDFATCALSGGGFAIIYRPSGGSLDNKLLTFNNAGTAVLAATTIWTRTGTSGAQYHQIEQLSNGNLAVAMQSMNTVSSIGLFYGVVTTAGVSVQAVTSLDSVAGNAEYPELAVMSGYFAVARANGTNQKAFVFNNAGTLQGSGYSVATLAGTGTGTGTIKLVSDGTAAFWLIHPQSTGSLEKLVKLPITGTNYTTNTINTSTTQYNFAIDAFYENGLICAISMAGTGNTAPTMWICSTDTGLLANPAGTTFGSVPGTTNGYYPRVIAGGDRAFIAMYDYTTTAGTFLCVGKYADTAVIGVAQVGAAADAVVRLYSAAGAYQTTATGGSGGVAFDHTTNNLVGNKGTILSRSVTLRGIGA